MKKIMLTLIAVLALCATLSACTKKKGEKVIDRLEGLQNNMSYQAVSSIKMLEIKEEFNTVKNLSGGTLLNQETVSEKEVIEKYLAMMEELMGNNGGINIASQTSDKPEYENMIVVTTKNLQDEETIYSLYYNETIVNEVDDDDDDDDDDDEIKEVKKITGIALANGKEYTLEGKTEVETEKDKSEKDESEKESYFKIIEDRNNYVIIEEEFEQELNESEHEYKYVVVSNGKKVSELEFELEQENGELSVEVKEITKDAKTSYKFKVIENGNNKYIKVEIKNGTKITKIKARIVYDTETNTYKYDYKYIEGENK